MTRKVYFRTWEEITTTDGYKYWHTVGYARRPKMLPYKQTDSNYFYKNKNGQRIKVSKIDKAVFEYDPLDGEYKFASKI